MKRFSFPSIYFVGKVQVSSINDSVRFESFPILCVTRTGSSTRSSSILWASKTYAESVLQIRKSNCIPVAFSVVFYSCLS